MKANSTARSVAIGFFIVLVGRYFMGKVFSHAFGVIILILGVAFILRIIEENE
jgi:hypothetical protein